MNRLMNTVCLVAITVHSSDNSVFRQTTIFIRYMTPRREKEKIRKKVTVAARISKPPRQIKILRQIRAPDE